MEAYKVQQYTYGGWAIVCKNTGKEIVVFTTKENANDACAFLNTDEE